MRVLLSTACVVAGQERPAGSVIDVPEAVGNPVISAGLGAQVKGDAPPAEEAAADPAAPPPPPPPAAAADLAEEE